METRIGKVWIDHDSKFVDRLVRRSSIEQPRLPLVSHRVSRRTRRSKRPNNLQTKKKQAKLATSCKRANDDDLVRTKKQANLPVY